MLPGLPGVDAAPWLLYLCRDDDPEVRLTAVFLIVTTGNPALLEKAEAIARADTDHGSESGRADRPISSAKLPQAADSDKPPAAKIATNPDRGPTWNGAHSAAVSLPGRFAQTGPIVAVRRCIAASFPRFVPQRHLRAMNPPGSISANQRRFVWSPLARIPHPAGMPAPRLRFATRTFRSSFDSRPRQGSHERRRFSDTARQRRQRASPVREPATIAYFIQYEPTYLFHTGGLYRFTRRGVTM